MKTPTFAAGRSAPLLAALLLAPTPLAAQQESCTVLCAPELKFEPTVTVENFVSAPRIAPLEDGVPVDTVQTGTETAFELVFALDVPSEIPRVGFTLEAIWAPFAETGANRFTGRTAEELGVEAVADNPVELEAEANVTLLTPEETGGWVDVHVDVIDQLSPAEQPDDTRLFTHKLDFELDTAVLLLHWLPESRPAFRAESGVGTGLRPWIRDARQPPPVRTGHGLDDGETESWSRVGTTSPAR